MGEHGRGEDAVGVSLAPAAVATRRYRNFDALRLAAAVAVVFSHSFLIADGNEGAEPFVRLFGEGNILGLFGVFTFFVISGFLITRSWQVRRSTGSYLAKRCLRIFPALVVCLAVCAALIGPWFTSLSLGDYLTDRDTAAFVFHHATLQLGTPPLPGVAFSTSDVGSVVMGTYWTLRPEFLMYLLVAAAGALGLLRLPVAALAVVVGIALHHREIGQFGDVLYLAAFFAAGSTLWFVHEHARPRRPAIVVAAAGLLVGAALGFPHEAFALFGSVLVIQLATSRRVRLPDAARYGDLSYGVYLFGWPVQQVIRSIAGDGITWWQLFSASLPIALGLAWLSWHLVERHAIALGERTRELGLRGALGLRRGHERAEAADRVAPEAP